jgi:integrase
MAPPAVSGMRRRGDMVLLLSSNERTERAGPEPSRYAGHSVRAGMATAAAAGGASERAIMQQTGHRSVVMVRKYIRRGTLFQENAAAYAGL